MGWLRLDDGYATHPKLLALASDAERWAWTRLLLHAAQHRRPEVTTSLVDVHPLLGDLDFLEKCGRVGLLDEIKGGGWKIHDWEEFNPRRAQTAAERAREYRKRKRESPAGASRKRDGKRHENVTDGGSESVTKTSRNEGRHENVTAASRKRHAKRHENVTATSRQRHENVTESDQIEVGYMQAETETASQERHENVTARHDLSGARASAPVPSPYLLPNVGEGDGGSYHTAGADGDAAAEPSPPSALTRDELAAAYPDALAIVDATEGWTPPALAAALTRNRTTPLPDEAYRGLFATACYRTWAATSEVAVPYGSTAPTVNGVGPPLEVVDTAVVPSDLAGAWS